MLRTVLSPTSPLFREARYLLADEVELHDTAVYHSVLAAIAAGNAHRGGIASYLGRKSGDLAHPLTVLEDCGLIIREPDVFRDNRTSFRIAEPLVTFYHAVMRPIRSDLEHTRDATGLWRRSRQRFAGNVLGPHFEQICRHWTRHLAPAGIFGEHPNRVGTGTVNDAAGRASYEVDLVAFGLDDDNRRPLIAIGEAKWGERMDRGHLDRLRRVRALLVAQGRPGAERAKLACFGGAGFDDELTRAAEQDGDIVLIGLEDLYRQG